MANAANRIQIDGPHLKRLHVEATLCGRNDAKALRHAWHLDCAISGTVAIRCEKCWEALRRMR